MAEKTTRKVAAKTAAPAEKRSGHSPMSRLRRRAAPVSATAHRQANSSAGGSDVNKSLSFLFDMPLAFLGFSLWRAWVSLCYASPAIAMPVNAAVGHLLYDVLLAAFALAAALLSSRLAPLAGKRATYLAIAVLLGFASAANALTASNPALIGALVWPSTLAGAAGSALLILLWCEIFSCLSAARVALYYSLALVGGVALTYLLEGFRDEYLYGALIVLPALSAALAHRSYRRYIPEMDRPRTTGRRLIPWKFFMILALFELAAGYCRTQVGTGFDDLIGSHSTITTLVGGVVLFLWVWLFADRLPLSAMYRAPVILLCCGMLLLPLFGLSGTVAGGFFVAISTTFFNAIVFLFLCDIAKRFGVSALLLFGIEEALILCGWVGQQAAIVLDENLAWSTFGPTVGVVAMIAVVAVVATLVLNEREVGEHWGIAFMGKRPPEETERTRLARRCAQAAKDYRLTARETEVLELLAAGKSLSGVAQELVIAEGTAKAHTRHIYEKIGINTRQELLDLLVVEEG